MPAFTLAALHARLGGDLIGDGSIELSGVASLEQAGPGQLSFVVNPKYVGTAQASGAAALVVPQKLADRFSQPRLAVANPHAVFARAIACFHPPMTFTPGIAAGAQVAAGAEIDPSASIAAGAVVEAGARVGARSRIDPGCMIGVNAVIGADCHLYPNVVVYADCHLGDRVVIHAGSVIGADGFGLAWENGAWVKVPQVGRVLIGDEVEIGANTTIDRGALDDTVIETGVKIDNLVQIAHNCRIGAYTAIAGCAGIAGSTRIGKNCLIGGAAMILGHIEIGDRVTVSGASFIGKSITEPGVFTSTQPQMPHQDWLKNAAQLRHLSDMRDRIRALEKKLAELEPTPK